MSAAAIDVKNGPVSGTGSEELVSSEGSAGDVTDSMSSISPEMTRRSSSMSLVYITTTQTYISWHLFQDNLWVSQYQKGTGKTILDFSGMSVVLVRAYAKICTLLTTLFSGSVRQYYN